MVASTCAYLDLFHEGILTAIRDWFRDYKIPDGKPANKFGLGNKPANKDYSLKVITETNKSWAKLVKRSIPAAGRCICNLTPTNDELEDGDDELFPEKVICFCGQILAVLLLAPWKSGTHDSEIVKDTTSNRGN
ncbi:hypothetical protein RND71_023389 [Anisodus tanguticus]|uniref:inorganic diphosphatase n=1 Tax=Anisodus tanguticus TaxID=243964 RepID=A0AAE1RSI2_9SOLA|nr:hypothetical protein RND71_023389 [Anisodus tanguticus]